MPEILQRGHVVSPVTAAAVIVVGQKVLLLIGEGACLKVFDDASNALLGTSQIFHSQAIHGIAIDRNVTTSSATCLVWGGRFIVVLQLTVTGSSISCTSSAKVLVVDDWICNACLSMDLVRHPGNSFFPFQAIFLTSHNVLYSLGLEPSPEPQTVPLLTCAVLATGPASVLYSAHVTILDAGEALVVAGTVFGDVIVWSFPLCSNSGHRPRQTPTVNSLHSFLGHEGSVFGVQISNAVFSLDDSQLYRQLYRIVVSCSDDRTIRVWTIPNVSGPSVDTKATMIHASDDADTGFGSHHSPHRQEGSQRCLATEMGHTSRIWGVTVLSDTAHSLTLLSYGEDATCCTWQLTKRIPFRSPATKNQHHTYALELIEIFRHHAGKNIWAATTIQKADGIWSVFTGGADGRIVSYNLSSNPKISTHMCCRKWETESSSFRVSILNRSSPVPSAKQAFAGIEGSWAIHRILESATLAYPSGSFDGTATLIRRIPTHDGYDLEYLYVEEGELKTMRGLIIKASRRYVYRYEDANESITAWFVKTDGSTEVDYLFHKVQFCEITPSAFRDERSKLRGMNTAKGHHLCIEDDYFAEYEFRYEAETVKCWNLKYTVKGPGKDYTATATYLRSNHNIAAKAERLTSVTKPWVGEFIFITSDSFKVYRWIGPKDFIATTAQGRILLGSVGASLGADGAVESYAEPQREAIDNNSIHWTLIDQHSELESYSLTTSFVTDIVLLGTASGLVYRYRRSTQSVDCFLQLPHKIVSLFAEVIEQPVEPSFQRIAVIGCCLGDPIAYYFNVEPGGAVLAETTKPIELALPPTFVVTSVCLATCKDFLVLGSRSGALCFFDCTLFTSTTTVSACSCIRHIHGEDAVTVVQNMPRQKSEIPGNLLLTAGKNGIIAVHRYWIGRELGTATVKLETIHTSEPPFGPNIEGALFESTNRDLLLWGFRSTDFVVWNETKKIEVMKVACGGCHRSWSYLPSNNGQDGGSFVWTKASTCHVRTQDRSSHRVLQFGSHGREIKAMAISPVQVLPDSRERYLVATGAEDTTIMMSSYTGVGGHFLSNSRCLGIISKHVTGIQQLQWSPDGRYLFSAGGMEEFYAWKIHEVPCIEVGFVCVAKCPNVTESSDLRVMDFDVVPVGNEVSDFFLVNIAYSDSTIRVWSFDPSLSGEFFKLCRVGTYTSCCLTHIKYTSFEHHNLLLTAATDGYIAFWPSDERQETYNEHDSLVYSKRPTSKAQTGSFQWSQRHRIHQNSIKCLSVLRLSRNDIIVATGGDDNAIAFTRVTRANESASPLSFSTLLLPKAHASTVAGIQCLDPSEAHKRQATTASYRFLTISNDQRLKHWTINVDTRKAGAEGLSVVRNANIYSSIADASCLEITPKDGSGRMAIVAGIGVESWGIDDS